MRMQNAPRKSSEQEKARSQADLYNGAARNMDWPKYCAAISAFYSTSSLKRPCHGYRDGGLSEDAFHSDLAAKRGIVFG